MCHESIFGHEIALAHEFISLTQVMLPPTVTTLLHMLEANGSINAERGMITIRNRSALGEFARDADRGPEREYHRM